MKDILRAVSEVTQISESEIVRGNQKRKTMEARFLFYFVSREKGYTHRDIGAFVNKAHSSVCFLLLSHSSKLKGLTEKCERIYDIIGTEEEIEISPFWDESFYIADMSSKYFGEYFVGMDKGIPVSCGGLCKVTNEMIGIYGTK